jgi:hypothetical protein
MATSFTYTFRRRCEGGGHVVLGVSFNGTDLGDYVYTTDEVRSPLSALSQEDREELALGVLKLRLQGMTRAQIVTLFGSPVTVTVQP